MLVSMSMSLCFIFVLLCMIRIFLIRFIVGIFFVWFWDGL